MGFSLIGAICGCFMAVFGSFVGVPYQLLKVLSIFFRVFFGCEQKPPSHRRYQKSPMLMRDSAGMLLSPDSSDNGGH